MSDKPFEPTPSRLERATREGDIARSQELSGVAAFGGAAAACLCIVLPLAAATRTAIIAASAQRHALGAVAAIAALGVVPAAAGAMAALLCGVLQGGGIRVAGFACKFDRLAPAENAKRILSRESAIAALRACATLACATLPLLSAFQAVCASALRSWAPESLAAAAWSGALQTALVCCIAGALFAAADYGVQYVRRLRRLRMSFDELKRDQKEHDGDPLARHRRRSMHRQIAKGSLQRLKDAAFVVVNPTHIAVALEYDPPAVAVPRVLLRAADDAAVRVRIAAATLDVPVVQHPPLARALFAGTRAGDVVPRDTYVALAEIVVALRRSGALCA